LRNNTNDAAQQGVEQLEPAEFRYDMDIVSGVRQVGRKPRVAMAHLSVDAMTGQGSRSVGIALETTVEGVTEQLADVEMSVVEAEQLQAAIGRLSLWPVVTDPNMATTYCAPAASITTSYGAYATVMIYIGEVYFYRGSHVG